MPAYRSSDEADIRNDVVLNIRCHWPSARIIHEINVSGQGSNRIDVLAVAPESIIAVEIKSKKDKLDRLPEQMRAMRRVAHFPIAAIHEKFLVEQKTNRYNAWRTGADGEHYCGALPECLRPISGATWVWPLRRRAMGTNHDSFENWRLGPVPWARALPDGALGMLWADELRILCAELRIGVSRTTVMSECIRLLRWNATGAEITRGICRALRRRKCVEADAPMEQAA